MIQKIYKILQEMIMRIIIKKNYDDLSKEAAGIIRNLIKTKPDCVLGLATGSTPIGLYRELIRFHKEEGLSFSRVTTFNLDEYYGLQPSHPQSYRYFMDTNLFKDIDIKPENTFVPEGSVKRQDIVRHCADYEQRIKKAGGIDIQVLGIGGDGHIAFNEPGSSFNSRTRLVSLDAQTINDNSRFFNNSEEVPQFALSMGIGTILEAREILFLASGENKADIVAQAIEGPLTSMVTASALQLHPKVNVILDEEAAFSLKRYSYYKFTQEAEGKIEMPIF